jgi:hypothetical protein
MVVDYDFTLGRHRLRGAGWRGLAALGMTLSWRAAILAVIAISAKATSAWLVHLLQPLLGQ